MSSDWYDWYKDRGVLHAHCPHGCDKPQPFLLDGKMICGRCAIMDKEIVEMIPCTPEVCD